MAAKMPRSRNFHVPLPPDVYDRLRAEAERTGRPATDLVRHAIQSMLRRRERLARHEAIMNYAAANAGSPLDLDEDLERAASEFLSEDDARNAALDLD